MGGRGYLGRSSHDVNLSGGSRKGQPGRVPVNFSPEGGINCDIGLCKKVSKRNIEFLPTRKPLPYVFPRAGVFTIGPLGPCPPPLGRRPKNVAN